MEIEHGCATGCHVIAIGPQASARPGFDARAGPLAKGRVGTMVQYPERSGGLIIHSSRGTRN